MATYIAAIEETRKLVSVVKIDEIKPIKKADFVELAIVGGWQVVVKKGEFNAGDLALYAEIDSLLPVSNPVWDFLATRKEGLKTFDDVVYSRIRTIKLRGELSQGLLTPVPDHLKNKAIGTNLTNDLNVRKWEEVIVNSEGLDARLNGASKGLIDRAIKAIAGKAAPSQFKPWPSALARSDQERVQNIGNQYAEAAEVGELFEETVKLDGQSMTVFDITDSGKARFGVCSRNYELSLEDIVFTKEQIIRRFLAQNLFALVGGTLSITRTVKYVLGQVKAKELTLAEAVKELIGRKYYWFTGIKTRISARSDMCVNYVLSNNLIGKLLEYNSKMNDTISVQGELIGPGIQSNYEQVAKHEFYVYQVYRDGNRKVLPEEARAITERLGMNYIPVVEQAVKLPPKIKDVLKLAEGKGAFSPDVKREGVVFKSLTRDFSFKVISNNYLLDKEKAATTEE